MLCASRQFCLPSSCSRDSDVHILGVNKVRYPPTRHSVHRWGNRVVLGLGSLRAVLRYPKGLGLGPALCSFCSLGQCFYSEQLRVLLPATSHSNCSSRCVDAFVVGAVSAAAAAAGPARGWSQRRHHASAGISFMAVLTTFGSPALWSRLAVKLSPVKSKSRALPFSLQPSKPQWHLTRAWRSSSCSCGCLAALVEEAS